MGQLRDPRYDGLVARLRNARVRARLTQQQAGKRLGLSQKQVSEIEKGQRAIGVYELYDFAQLYGIPMMDLVEDRQQPGSEASPAGERAKRVAERGKKPSARPREGRRGPPPSRS